MESYWDFHNSTFRLNRTLIDTAWLIACDIPEKDWKDIMKVISQTKSGKLTARCDFVGKLYGRDDEHEMRVESIASLRKVSKVIRTDEEWDDLVELQLAWSLWWGALWVLWAYGEIDA